MEADYRGGPSHRSPFLLHDAVLPSSLLVAALCIPDQSWLTTSIFLPAILACHYRLLHTTSVNPSFGYAVGTYVAMHTYTTLNLLVFSNPRRDFRRLSPPTYQPATAANGTANGKANGAANGTANGKANGAANGTANGTKGNATEAPRGTGYPKDSLLQRLGWVFELTESMRGIGWSWQIRPIRSVDPRELTSVWTFFRRRIVRLFLILLWLDFLCWLMRDIDGAYFLPEGNAFRNPDTFVPIYRSLFSPMQQELSIPKGFPPVPQAEDSWLVRTAYLLFLRTARVFFAGSAMYATINGPYTIVSVLAASMGCIFGLGEPESWRRRWLDWRAWPDIFGGLRQNDWGHGIFGWWGTAWHGLFKNCFIAPGRAIISSLGLQKNGAAAKTVSLVMPFAISGGLHFAGCYTQSGGGWGSVRFFLLQPVGILLERIFLHIYRRFVPASMRSAVLETALPYLWTLAWFTAVSPSFFDEYRHGGVWAVEPVPFSVFRGARGDGWWHWGQSPDGRDWWRWHDSLGGWGIEL